MKDKCIPLIVIKDSSELDNILIRLKKNNYNTAEITFRTPCAEQAIKDASKKFPEMNIGAGTIINTEQALRAINAGAKFIISPGLDVDVAKLCLEKGIEYIPGCVTPSEIMKALSLGITTIKFFPANLYGGVSAIKAFSSPFPQVKFIPTGGINSSNMEEYLSCKNVVAIGGSFFVNEVLK